jgi:hypothetical protein
MLNQSSELAFAVVGAISMGILTGLCLAIIYTVTMI